MFSAGRESWSDRRLHGRVLEDGGPAQADLAADLLRESPHLDGAQIGHPAGQRDASGRHVEEVRCSCGHGDALIPHES